MGVVVPIWLGLVLGINAVPWEWQPNLQILGGDCRISRRRHFLQDMLLVCVLTFVQNIIQQGLSRDNHDWATRNTILEVSDELVGREVGTQPSVLRGRSNSGDSDLQHEISDESVGGRNVLHNILTKGGLVTDGQFIGIVDDFFLLARSRLERFKPNRRLSDSFVGVDQVIVLDACAEKMGHFGV